MRTTLTVALLLALGLLVRIAGLERVPPALWSDEANNGLDANDILAGHTPVFFPGNCGQEPLLKYLIAGTTRMMGAGARAVRSAAGISGWFLLPLAYVWFRRRRGSAAALWLLVFLAIGVWHLQFSRISFRAIMGPTLGMTALLAVDAVSRHPTLLRGMNVGAIAGLSWYTYPAHRALPLIAILWLLLSFRAPKRAFLRCLLTCVAGFALCLIPMLLAWKDNPALFTARASMAAIWSETPDLLGGLLRNTIRHAGMFVVEGDLNWRHNLSGAPQLDILTGFFFIVGLGRALGRRDRLDVLLLSWLAVMLIPGILSVERQAPHSLRTIGILPVPYMLAAEGIQFVGGIIPRRRFWRIAGVLTAVSVLLLNAQRYFVAWPARLATLSPVDESLFGFNRQEHDLAMWLTEQRDGTVWLSPQLFLHPTTAYLAEGAKYRMLVHVDSLRSGDRLVLQLASRNLWWLREDFRKNFFLWWWTHGRTTESDTWQSLAAFYPTCGGGMEKANDRLALDLIERDFETNLVDSVAGLRVFQLAARRGLHRANHMKELAEWQRVPAGCFQVRVDSFPLGLRELVLWAREEDSDRTWRLDSAERSPSGGCVLRGCLLWPSCIRVRPDPADLPGGPPSIAGTLAFEHRADPEPYLRRTSWGRFRNLLARVRQTLHPT